jgi:hypothetical protein
MAVRQPDGSGPDKTDAGSPKAADTRPSFENMDEAGIKDWFTEFTAYLRDRDAVVRGPKTATFARDKDGVLGESKEDKADIFETRYEWQYDEKQPPVTIVNVAGTYLESLRGCAGESMRRRFEV